MNKKLLFVAPFNPFPMNSGGRNRIYHELKYLGKLFKINLHSFSDKIDDGQANIHFFQSLNISNTLFNLSNKSFFSFFKFGQPYWFSDWYNLELAKAIKNNSSSYNHIIIENSQLLYLSRYLPGIINRIFVAQGISTITFWRRLCLEKNVLKIFLHFLRLLEIYFYERKYLPMFSVVVAMSDHDKLILEKYFDCKNVVVIGNGISSCKIRESQKKISNDEIKIGFIGSAFHSPNVNAVKRIYKQLLPEMLKHGIKYKFYLAGDYPEDFIDKLKNQFKESFIYLGYLENLSDFYGSINLLLAPIDSGSGTRLKILESLSFGVPVLTTKIGAEGINIRSSYLRIIEKNQDHPEQWLRCIQEIKNNSFDIEDKMKLESSLISYLWSNVLKEFNTLLLS